MNRLEFSPKIEGFGDLPMASRADSRDRSDVFASVTLRTKMGIHCPHRLTGISATATDATHWAADDGRAVSVPIA